MLTLVNFDFQNFASSRACEAILRRMTIIELAESKTVLAPGQFQEHLYFIKKGVVRCYYQSYEVECTNWFASEGNFIFSTESFLYGKPSPEYIQTCSPVVLYQISRQDYQQLLEAFPELYVRALGILQNRLCMSEKRTQGYYMQTAYERYEDFIKTHQHLSNRVKMQHIASYLGVTPTHLSRIRRKFARKNDDDNVTY